MNNDNGVILKESSGEWVGKVVNSLTLDDMFSCAIRDGYSGWCAWVYCSCGRV